MEIWHLRFSSDGRHPLFPSERARRAAILILVGHAAPWLVAFGVVDDHLHVVVVCSRERAGKLSRAIVLGLRPISGLGFEPSYIKQVESRAHLLRLVGYCIEQPQKHGLAEAPALWSGSCFSDIVGARAIAGLRLRIPEVLPRYRSADAWRAAGQVPGSITRASDEQIRAAGLSSLRKAASFATGAPPELDRRTMPVTRARGAVVQLAHCAGFRSGDLAEILDISSEAVRKLGRRPPDEATLTATRLRLAIQLRLEADARIRRR